PRSQAGKFNSGRNWSKCSSARASVSCVKLSASLASPINRAIHRRRGARCRSVRAANASACPARIAAISSVSGRSSGAAIFRLELCVQLLKLRIVVPRLELLVLARLLRRQVGLALGQCLAQVGQHAGPVLFLGGAAGTAEMCSCLERLHLVGGNGLGL